MRQSSAQLLSLVVSLAASAQTYTINTIAGGALPVGVPGASAVLGSTSGLPTDAAGNVYIPMSDYHIVVKLDLAGNLSRVAGTGFRGFGGDGGAATSAQLSFPQGVALDASGNLYIADRGNGAIRKVAAATGKISTVAGHGTCCDFHDNVQATSIYLQGADRLAINPTGDLFIAESGTNRIRLVAAATGIITTIAGDGTQGYNGDGIPATSAKLAGASSVATDSAGGAAEDYARWLTRHLSNTYEELLNEPWILDMDGTVKPLYGHQEQAVVGYNPTKCGRPSHVYQTYFIAVIRMVLDVEVQAGNQTASQYAQPGLWSWLDARPRERWPALVRGDIAWGTERMMLECEKRKGSVYK